LTGAASPGRRIAVYLLATVALSSVFWVAIVRAGSLGARGGLFAFGLMWCPGAAAILASLLCRRTLREIGWRWSWRFALLAYAIPVAYAGLAYGAAWALHLGSVPNPAFLERIGERFGSPGASPAALLFKYVVSQGTAGVLVSCLAGLGEEIGWRGFLVPELARRMSFPRVALASGTIWALWHYPLVLFSDYNGGTPAWYSLGCFTVLVLGISFLFAWMRLASGSVWPAAILHGSHNLWIQGVFDPLTADTGPTKWVIGEFGGALALAAVAVALLTLRRSRAFSAVSARAAA
jgi:uncharacterized protein